MPFSPDIKERALVSAARYCCVCHRYRGVKVEVHHIIPQDKGGNDTLENAIPLCFDCHTDAGHYNPRHPKGTRFSPRELQRHRDAWYDIVRTNQVEIVQEEDRLHCRYLICKTFDLLSEISGGDLSRFPARQPLLVENDVYSFMRKIVALYPKGRRPKQSTGRSFSSKKEFLEVYPHAEETDKSDSHSYPYFEVTRPPNVDELEAEVGDEPLTGLMLRAGNAPGDLARILAYYEECGSGGFQELLLFRPFWVGFLAATNVSSRPLSLLQIEAHYEPIATFLLRTFPDKLSQGAHSVSLPAAPIAPGDTAVIPLMTFVGPLDDAPTDCWSSDITELELAHAQEVAHCSYESEKKRISLIGPALWPRTILCSAGSMSLRQDVHVLDLGNLYTIDRHWAMGSCPHLFFMSTTGVLRYHCPLFGDDDTLQEHAVTIPVDITQVVIAELEQEVTYVQALFINGAPILDGRVLSEGQSLRFSVAPGDLVRIRGRYRSVAAIPQPTSAIRRNFVVASFMREAT